MSAQAQGMFDSHEVAIAIGVALLAQLVFVATFQLPSPKLVQADISNDNAQPIAVSITPILKLGTKNPTNVPSQWQRRKPSPPKPPDLAPLPSPQAAKTPEAIPTARVQDAAAPLPIPSASAVASADTTAPALARA